MLSCPILGVYVIENVAWRVRKFPPEYVGWVKKAGDFAQETKIHIQFEIKKLNMTYYLTKSPKGWDNLKDSCMSQFPNPLMTLTSKENTWIVAHLKSTDSCVLQHS